MNFKMFLLSFYKVKIIKFEIYIIKTNSSTENSTPSYNQSTSLVIKREKILEGEISSDFLF